MNQDSTEAPVDERAAPGESIARRLFSRGATRASVGPRAEFYHRLGVADPYSVTETEEAAGEGPFTFLSSSAYFRDLRRSRLGLLSRISAGARKSGFIGSRLRRVGPAAAMVRPSALARLGLGEDDFTVLVDPLLAQDEEEEDPFSYRIIPRQPKARIVTPRTRERVVFRPVAQAMAREGGEADDELTRVLQRVLSGFRGRERRELQAILEEVATQPAARRMAVAKQALRRLQGPARALAQAETAEVFEAEGMRPMQVAAGRSTAAPTSKGLRRVLGTSAAVLMLEAPPEAAEEVAEATPRAVRRIQAPTAARRTPATRRSSPREAARTQQASGRAGPTLPAVAPATAPAARVASRRPMERMAARAQHAAATPSYVEGLGSRSVAQTRARVGALVREEAGQPEFGDRAPMSRAATGYVRRRRPQGPDAVLVTAEIGGPNEPLEEQSAPVQRVTPRQARERRSPIAAASQRAVERADAVAPAQPRAARVATSAVEHPRAGGLRATAGRAQTAPAPVRRRLASSPTSYVARSAAGSEEQAQLGSTGFRVARLRRRSAAQRAAGTPVGSGSIAPQTPETATVRAARRGAPATVSVSTRRRSVLPPLATSYLTIDVDEALAEAAPVTRPSARRRSESVVAAARVPQTGLAGTAGGSVVAPTQRATARGLAVEEAAQATTDGLQERATPTARRIALRGQALELAEEAPVVRAARRSASGALPEVRRGRTVLPLVATSYLAHELDDAPEGPELGATLAPRRRAAPVAAAEAAVAPGSAASVPAATASRRAVAERASADGPVVRAARRRVAPGRVTASRSVLASVPTAYLQATDDEVAEALPVAVSEPRQAKARPTQRAALRGQPMVATEASGRVALAAPPVAYAAVDASDEPMLTASPVPGRRAASIGTASVLAEPALDTGDVSLSLGATSRRRRLEGPEQVLAQSQGVEGEGEEGGELSTGAAPTKRAAARGVAAAGPRRSDDGSERPAVERPAARIAARAEEAATVAASVMKSEGGAATAPARRAARRSPLADAVLPGLAQAESQGEAVAAPATASRRPSARVAARMAPQPRLRSAAAVSAHRALRPRKSSQAATVSVGAMAAASLRSHHEPMSGSVAPRPVSRFDWAAVVDEVVATYQGQRRELGGQVAGRRVLGRDDLQLALDESVPADVAEVSGKPVALREVAKRTREAVHALGRIERSVLTFDASRRTFGDVAGREHTVVARVQQDAQGRVRRVRATRLATGEHVLLDHDAVQGLEAHEQQQAPRPSQAAWVEERATVGRAASRGQGELAPVREAPGARLVERAAAPEGRVARRRPRPVVGGTLAQPATTARDADMSPQVRRQRPGRRPVSLGPVTLASAALPALVPEEAELGSTVGRRSPAVPLAARQLAAVDDAESEHEGSLVGARSLRRSMVSLDDAQRTPSRRRPTAARRQARRRQAASGLEEAAVSAEQTLARPWSPEEAVQGSSEGAASAPGWVRRANEGTSVPVRPEVPDAFLRPRLRTGGGLLTALARAGDAEDVVRVILERSHDLGDASLLPVAAQRLMHRVADEAHQVAAAARGERVTRGSSAAPRMVETVKNNILQPVTVAAPGARSTATKRQGVGASKVMKLANKLMKLIHLAEADGRGDAHKHVRMSEDTAESRAEGGAGGMSGDQFDEKTMNIKALRQDVLDAVLKALEDMRWRREDPDGPSIWC